jgi:aminomuconate-semialdehyde/2-hydroxymuconate-6-semialdehyde dehydrogenase
MSALLKNYVGGQFVEGASWFENINPVDGSINGRVSEAGPAVVEQAVAAAQSALAGEWGQSRLGQRVAILREIADAIEGRYDEFVAAEIADTGKSYDQVHRIDIPRAAANFRNFANLAMAQQTESWLLDESDARSALNYSLRRPVGVVAVISPWNLPLLLLTWKVAPALAMGNAVIAKPSEETPSTATLLAEVIHSTSLPKGAFNLVHGFGAGSTGELLVSNPGVDAITFTGESRTGEAIMAAAAAGVRPVSFELGGKNAAIVFADADFDAAVEGVARSSFTNCGQVCLCSERVYVQRPIFERFLAALKARAAKITIGRPSDGVDMGPLISRNHREKVLSYFRLAVEEGATVELGGDVPVFGDERDNGAFINPTIWSGLPNSARCLQEEVFGPVCHVMPFDNADEAVSLANDSQYGLCAAVWTSNLNTAHHVAGCLKVGIVWVNDWFLRDLRTPFGGAKISGLGREGGWHSFDFYSEPTNVCIKL